TRLLSVAHQRQSHERSYRLRSMRSMLLRARSESRVPRTFVASVSLMRERSVIVPPVSSETLLATSAVDSESFRISEATTPNAAPAWPHRADSICAFRDKRRDWLLRFSIR